MATIPHLQLHQPQSQPQQPQSKPFMNFVPIDPQIFATSTLPNPSPPYVHVMGIAPAGEGAVVEGWEPNRKRVKEQEFLEDSQISSIDFLHTGGSVSTGLGLSLDDRRVGVSSGESSLVLSSIDEEIGREIQRQDAEMDRFLKLQGERLRQQILEKVQAKQFQTLASVEEKFLRKIREKEAEVEDINRKNTELEEQMKQLSVEVAAWQHRAKYNESMISALKLNLQKVYAQSRDNNREGCGDSEVDDTASCCNGGAINFQLMCKENKDMKELMTCRVCRVNEVSMLLLPCRHLCLCKDCESKLSFCPLCHCSKLFGTEIYM
ncbi:probable BOI-related E3 ubiquitin-protein ligase 2 [Dioscorea cayenensis subsp. rotundata]|uniref:Probable BOI-related E3 ubiquitin-protein ligase 2 n=1 Tax=Dioscorea cayennensis subsp. rotundata TaxID=55577 RepID=A0AB40BK58_DIOCR|nr:probable BOI-related E3 ubiquitin-protein ligase 2 [Dioscorea cayenensis subsp. rotundata]